MPYLQTPGPVMEGVMDENRCIVIFTTIGIVIKVIFSIIVNIVITGAVMQQDADRKSIVIFITFILVILVICRGRQGMCTLVELATREGSTLGLCSLKGILPNSADFCVFVWYLQKTQLRICFNTGGKALPKKTESPLYIPIMLLFI